MIARLDAAVAEIQKRTSVVPQVGVVLGSGLGPLVDAIEPDVRIPYAEIPGFSESTVEGHEGALIVGHVGGVPVVAMSGRLHLYEGYTLDQVVFPVRVLVRLGAGIVVLTNAAGGIHPQFRTQDIMVINDQLNLTGQNPLIGANPPALGLRFPDMTHAYDAALRARIHRTAEEQGLTLKDGVYAGLPGPSYETPAEIRMLRTLGADAVGMSTVNEVIAVRHMGARVLGLSAITNLAAGLSSSELTHEEVAVAARAIQDRLTRLVAETIQGLAG